MEEEVERQVSERVYVEKKALVTFIAGVINSTSGETSKTTKIQLVVKAAFSHLGVEGLSWEEVQKDLQAVSLSAAFSHLGVEGLSWEEVQKDLQAVSGSQKP